MVGYGEIRYRDDASFYGWWGDQLPSALQYALQGIVHPRLLSVTIAHQEELFQVLQTFLQPREGHPLNWAPSAHAVAGGTTDV
jgi:hypothetical protein